MNGVIAAAMSKTMHVATGRLSRTPLRGLSPISDTTIAPTKSQISGRMNHSFSAIVVPFFRSSQSAQGPIRCGGQGGEAILFLLDQGGESGEHLLDRRLQRFQNRAGVDAQDETQHGEWSEHADLAQD